MDDHHIKAVFNTLSRNKDGFNTAKVLTGAGYRAAVTAASASGWRSWPEIRRGSRVSRIAKIYPVKQVWTAGNRSELICKRNNSQFIEAARDSRRQPFSGFAAHS